ncbi:outer membrane beta-barrel protein [Pedobacter sp. SL55]|uniref:outer membrane beta-barrel protein n=1 Tax=Pedobacter sp. SL55 TaxID=2995161 RepID=UPI00226F606D|nr:outer membrane beta-barrel protein [Pedobacter sp. SL55]WAC38979.1 outer membrane beta-barrel protein [Pedobacter sp. SL55]
MKHLILKAVLVSGLTFLAAGALKAQSDSTKVKIDYGKGISIDSNRKAKKVTISIGNGNIVQINGDSSANKNGRFVGGVTFTRLDIGLTKLVDNGSFSLSPTNDFLDYKPWKTSTVSFDVLQFGYRFSNHFKVYLAGGFDWTLIRLDRNITIKKDVPVLDYDVITDATFSKNRFSASYVHFPLNFEFRTKEDHKGKRFRFVVGPEVAFLLGGKVKQISEERGKVKFTDDYNFTPFRYGGTARIGYGGLGLFAKYSASDLFDTDAQKGLKAMSFGITFGLN